MDGWEERQRAEASSSWALVTRAQEGTSAGTRLWGSRNGKQTASERHIAGRHEVESTRPDERLQVHSLSRREGSSRLRAELFGNVVVH